MPSHPTDPSPVAYSYVRFSSKRQEEGDSIRRQTELTAKWADREGVHLDTSLKIDKGVSAYRGKNKDLGALADFVRMVDTGRVLPGSYLVVESLDRITRQEVQPALRFILDILAKGIRVVQLSPVEVTYDDKSELTALVLMIVELSRANSESKVKSERVSQAWAQRRKNAREGNGVMTKKLPGWLKGEGDYIAVIPERAKVVQRIFDMSAGGHGLFSIMTRLNADNVPTFGTGKKWSITYISNVLNDRRALGEFQPRLRGNVPDGGPIPGYFPRVVSDESWERSQLAYRQRKRTPGRTGDHVNVFQGLLRDARNGAPYVVTWQTGRERYRSLVPTASRRGLGDAFSFPFAPFENAVLRFLREVDPHEILNGDHGPDDALCIAGNLATVDERIADIERELLGGSDVPSLVRVLRTLETQRKELAEQLAEARRRARHPLSESWGEAQGILQALADAPDPREARLRLRTALRRIVEAVYLLIVPKGRDRLAWVQLRFAGKDRCRDYLIAYRGARGNGRPGQCNPARTYAVSTSDEGIAPRCLLDFDLRDPADVSQVVALLEGFTREDVADMLDRADQRTQETP